MKKNRFTLDELLQELRAKGAMDPSKVEYAILETDGRLNVILYPAETPVTAAMLELTVADGGYPMTVVSDGRVLSENLRRSGHDEPWLREELRKRQFRDSRDVYLMTVNRDGQIYLAGKEQR